jgi:hypothetical protein
MALVVYGCGARLVAQSEIYMQKPETETEMLSTINFANKQSDGAFVL